MILLGNLLIGVGNILGGVLNFLSIFIFISVILSWFRVNPYNPLVNYVNTVCEVLYRIPRKYMNTVFGPLDVAPIIVLFGIYLLQMVVVSSMVDYGSMIRRSSFNSLVQQERQIAIDGFKGRSL